ncbi:monocarboxylate transporter 12-B-like [Physella acuta]|uniref:monocarboxylate transporter 12-B-like n=1 Tax=Physella acuta TaxID=109671 RepID=UPI0027DBDC76|nr:monocarboxylate transporter 12-B-like [Physella acuta]
MKVSRNSRVESKGSDDVLRHKNIVRGYAWVVVLASFFNAFIIDGIGSSFGLLFPYMKEKFNASDFVMSFAGSLYMAFLIMGTVSVALTKRFGFRVVTIAGGLLSCMAFVASAYIPNVILFILAYGLLAGCGCGLVFLPSIIIVNEYFYKFRGIANGIICSGSGAGLLALAPLITYLLDTYTLDSTILILAGIMLNMCVFSSLYRLPPVLHKASNSVQESNTSESSSLTTSFQSPLVLSQETNIGDSVRHTTQDADETVEHVPADGRPSARNSMQKYLEHVVSKLSAPKAPTLKRTHNGERKLAVNGKSHKESLWRSEFQLSPSSEPQPRTLHSSVHNIPTWCHHSHTCPHTSDKKITNHTPSFLSIDNGSNLYLSGSISTLKNLQKNYIQNHTQQHASAKSLTQQQSSSRILVQVEELPSDQWDKSHNQCDQDKDQIIPILYSAIKAHENSDCPVYSYENEGVPDGVEDEDIPPAGYSIVQLLCMPSFHLFCWGVSLIQIGYPIAATFLANYAKQLGYPDTNLLMILLGGLNILGRLLAGVMASFKFDPLHLNNASLLLVGVCCLLCPLYQQFWSLALFAALYGFLLGFFPPLQPLIIVKQFGLGSLASAFGFLTTIKGLASMLGTPLAGWIYDASGQYALSFVFGGAVFVTSGLVHYLILCVRR